MEQCHRWADEGIVNFYRINRSFLNLSVVTTKQRFKSLRGNYPAIVVKTLMKNAKFLFLTYLLTFIFLVAQADAISYSVDLQLTTLTTEQCPYSTVQIVGKLTNTGDATETYKLTPDSPWIKIAPDTVTLESFQRATVYVYVTPTLAVSGKYPLKINVKSANAKDAETIELNLLKCHDVELVSKTTAQSACIGDNAEFQITITNAGKFSETFDVITSDKPKEPSPVSLSSGQSKTLKIVTPVANAKQTITVNAKSQTSYASDSLDLKINGAACYLSSMDIAPTTASVCSGDQGSFSINLKNTGTKADTFALSANAGALSASSSTIEPGQSRVVTLTHTPAKVGITEFEISAASNYQKLKATATLNSVECRGVAVLVVPDKIEAVKGDMLNFNATVKNTGRKTDTYVLTTSMGTISPSSLTIDGGGIRTAVVTVDTSKLDLGMHNVTINANDGASDKFVATFSLEEGHLGLFELKSPADVNVCANEEAEYIFSLKNTGKRTDTYAITATEGMSSDTKVVLEAGKSKDITVKLPSTYKDEGTKSAIVTATGINLNHTYKVNVGYRNFDSCYGFEISATPSNATIESYKPEEYKPALFTINVKNTGKFDNNYTFTATGPNWSYVDPKTVGIVANGEGKTFAYMAPPYKIPVGTYETIVKATSLQGISKEVAVKLTLETSNNLTQPEDEQSTEIAGTMNETPAVATNETAIPANETEVQTTTNETTTEEPAETTMPGVYSADFDRKGTILLIKGETVELNVSYIDKDGNEHKETVSIAPTSFSGIQPKNATISVPAENKQYELFLDVIDANIEPEFYRFKVLSVNVIEKALESAADGTGANATAEPSETDTKRSKKLPLIIGALALLVVLTIAYWPTISKKWKTRSDKHEKSKKKKSDKKEDIKDILENI